MADQRLEKTSSDGSTLYYSAIESSFEAVWEHASDAIIIADSEGKIIYANPMYSLLYGFEEEEQKDQYFTTLFPEKDPQQSIQKYKSLFGQAEEKHLLESRIIWADGCERIIETALHFIHQNTARTALVAVIRDITGKRIVQERKQLENALIESERRFRTIFNQTFQFLGLIKPDGTVLEVNRTLIDFAGLASADVVNKPLWEAPWWVNTPKNQQKLRTMITEAAKGMLMREEFELTGADKNVITVDFSLTPVKDEAGKVVFLIPEGRDITYRKVIERKLRSSEEKFKTLFQLYTAGIAITDAKGKVIDINPAAEQILSATKETLVGRYFDEVGWKLIDRAGVQVSPQEWPINKALENQAMQDEELGLVRSDESVSWLRITAMPIPIKGFGVAVTFTDISSLKQQEASILESEERYRLLFENNKYAIIRTTADLKLLQANTEACRLLGYPEESNLQHLPLFDEKDERVQMALLECATTRKYRGELPLLKADGTQLLAELLIKLFVYSDGQEEGSLTIRSTK